MRRYAAAFLITTSLAATSQAEAKSFWKQAGIDIRNGLKHIVPKKAPDQGPQTITLPPDRMNPCGGNNCMRQ